MLTAIILSHNNGSTIGKTLASLSFCDERILIDDYSSDDTVEIAKKMGVKVYQRALNGDFAAQRNYGLSLVAKGPASPKTSSRGEDWVLFIDSDEVVSKALADEIQKATAIDADGFFIKRDDTVFGKKLHFGETGRVRLLRLAKKDAGQWRRPVHEVWDVKGVIGTLESPIVHFPHPDVAQFIDEINTYSTLNAKYFFKENIRVPGWHIFAYPAAKFFMDYFWYQGFRDGTAGAVVALMMSLHSFLTRAKLWLMWHHHENS